MLTVNLFPSLSCSVIALLFAFSAAAQPPPGYWQQRVEYRMDIDFDVAKHRYNGEQVLTYFNNSPDTLHRVFYHLYLNAFQPGSMMELRSRNIRDADARMATRIAALKPDEIGYQKINSLTLNGTATDWKVVGTILEVTLPHPILPGEKAVLDMQFEAQVPPQIRRNGRNNREGIDYSMAQWFPKICAYDRHGWHADDYIAREFYGVFGDFDVRIAIDARYVVAATGVLQNPNETGHGYGTAETKPARSGEKLNWHFKAEKVNDFVWAADPDYKHVILTRKDGTVLRFFYQPGEPTEAWDKLPDIMDRAFDYINARFGQYPYPEYAFIQGGDGGMEYPMATLITGNRPLNSLVGVSVHELMHCWYPMVLGTNEARYAWMDEGFVNYATADVMHFLSKEGLLPTWSSSGFPQRGDYQGYINIASGDWEEPLSTPSDHFQSNTAYGVGSYNKGSVFLSQLGYVIGAEALNAGLLRYFDEWQFKHPDDKDFIRVMEKVSGMELDWYLDYFVYSTHTIDYGIVSVESGARRETQIKLARIGAMPMPVDVEVTLRNGKRLRYNIPLGMMRGHKASDTRFGEFDVLPIWRWVAPDYTFTVPVPVGEITRVHIDPSGRLADVKRDNNERVMR
jgi:hypothetical protein